MNDLINDAIDGLNKDKLKDIQPEIYIKDNNATSIMDNVNNVVNKDLNNIRELYKYINSVQIELNRHTTIFLDIWELIKSYSKSFNLR